MSTSSSPPTIPKRSDRDYDIKVSNIDVTPPQGLVICENLVSAWGDCEQVAKDCNDLLRSAYDASSKNAKPDEVRSYLVKVRQRLVQAWDSQRKHKLIWGILAWLVVVLGGCGFVLVWFHLLPGETPKVAISNTDLAALYSSFLFGAVGGLFDALSALSKNYTEETFDADHWPWYGLSPFLGAILGAVVFAVFLAGLLATTGAGIPGQGNTTQAVQVTTVPTATSARAAFILVVAFLAGFKQIAVVHYLEGIANSLFPGGKESKESK